MPPPRCPHPSPRTIGSLTPPRFLGLMVTQETRGVNFLNCIRSSPSSSSVADVIGSLSKWLQNCYVRGTRQSMRSVLWTWRPRPKGEVACRSDKRRFASSIRRISENRFVIETSYCRTTILLISYTRAPQQYAVRAR